MAMNVDRSVFRDFVKSLTQGVKRNVNKAVNFTVHYFIRCTGVEQEHAAVTGKVFHVVPEELLELSADGIFGNEAEHIDGVFGAAERRRIAKFKGGKVGNFRTETDGGGKYVHALVHAVKTDDLRADLLSNIASEQRAKVVYEYLYRQIDDKKVRETIDFLLNREEAHNQMFRDAFNKVQNSGSNRDFGTTKAAKMYFSMSDPGPNAFATGDTKPVSFE